MPSFSGYKVPICNIILCCLLRLTSLTSIHELLINLIVVHQVNVTVLNSLWWQVCTDGVISRLGDDKPVFLQRLQERKQTKEYITNKGLESCPTQGHQQLSSAQPRIFFKLTSSPLSSGVRSSTAPEITLQRQSRSARYPRSIGVPADSAIFKKSTGKFTVATLT